MERSFVVISLIVSLVLVLGCQDQQSLSELQEFKALAEVEAQNIDLVERLIEGINQRNDGIYDELCAPDYAWYFPSTNPNPYSLEEEQDFVKLLWAGFPDITWTIDDIFAADDKVFVKFTSRGTHEGEYQGLAPTGNTFVVSGFIVYRIENGKITEAGEEADLLGMMQQLGMELRPAADME